MPSPGPSLNLESSLTPEAAAAWRRHALLSTREMYAADRAAIAAGTPGIALMERAGAAIARAILMRWKARPVSILCGPGNNGGDGFVVARLLAEAGWPVGVALLGERAALRGDAGLAASRWTGPIAPLTIDAMSGAGLIVDALFGAGLDRPLEGVARAAVEAMAASRLPLVAVDVPSGVAGDSGAVLGAAAGASLTVTFFRRKPGHLLYPGRDLCGETVVAEIGIPESVLEAAPPSLAANAPALWRHAYRPPSAADHKYSRGHVGVIAGAMPGAARLAATAAARSGAGMVTLLGPRPRVEAAAGAPACLIATALDGPHELAEAVVGRRIAALLIGPGLGRGEGDAAWVDAALALGLPTVLDADALNAFARAADRLAGAVRAPLIVTPHDGEYARLFAAKGSRLERARHAAAALRAVAVLKGADSVVAAPGGRAVIADNAPPTLATAGSGDVLAGAILALLGQGMPAFEAAAAAVWLHGAAARRGGPVPIADDLPPAIGPAMVEAGLRN